jgi:predicted RNA-binding Zn ribbon-like protein
MNTIWADRAGVHDELQTTGALADWLVYIEATDRPARVSSQDLARARELRDALRCVAAFCTDASGDRGPSMATEIDAAIDEINSVAAACPSTPRLARLDGKLVVTLAAVGPRVTRALAAVATEAIELLTRADAPRLRACRAPGCVLYFVQDHPRREWCSNACGNRARAARHYRRHRRTERANQTNAVDQSS